MEKSTRNTTSFWITYSWFQENLFVGIGSSFWVAKIAEFLWREYVHMDAIAINSYDFVNSKYFVHASDVVTVCHQEMPPGEDDNKGS